MLAKAIIRRQSGFITNNTVIPFLYFTKTILRRYTADRDVPFETTNGSDERQHDEDSQQLRRLIHQSEGGRNDELSSSIPTRRQQNDGSSDQPYIPFERPFRPNKHAHFEGTTITPTERRAFEGLFKLHDVSEAKDKSSPNARMSRKRNERGRDRPGGLDAILENALESIDSRGRPRAEFPAALRPLAEESRVRSAREKAKGGVRRVVGDGAEQEPSQTDALQRAAKTEVGIIMKKMNGAETDVEIWQILNEEVFEWVRALELDGPTASGTVDKKKKKKGRKKVAHDNGENTTSAAAAPENDKGSAASSLSMTATPLPPGFTPLYLLSLTLPWILFRTIGFHSIRFPLSPLALSVLPTLQTLGPTATALGLSTKVYNAHMRVLYRRYGDVHAVADMLAEMEREVYEFDAETAVLVNEILDEEHMKWEGGRGESGKAVAGMERGRLGWRRLLEWKEILRGRRVEEALKRMKVREEWEALVGGEEGEEDERPREGLHI